MTSVIAGRYRLDARIGQGGTGEVWRALDERLERPVAIKLLHPWIAADDDARRRFRREATVMARLRHPNIVQVLDFDETSERPFLVQEHCAGGTLSALAEAAPLPWERVAAIALSISRALDHAHAGGVIHRDLKPSNVLFGVDGHLLVGDFGLARVVAGDDGTLTGSGVRLGSPEYWAPEQAAGEPVSERADLYSLGCILYRLASGTLPYGGDDRLAAGYRRVHEQARPALHANPLIPGAGSELIERLMRRDPSARPRAADVVAELAGEGGATRPAHTAITWHAQTLPAGDATAVMESTTPTLATGVVDAPTRIAGPPPRRRVVLPPDLPAAHPQPSSAYPGVRLRLAITGLVLFAAGSAAAAVADRRSAGVALRRAGIHVGRGLNRDGAISALGALGGAALATIGVSLLAIWAARSSGHSRFAVVRGALALLSVLLAAAAAGGLVWTAHAAVGLDLGALWRTASRG